jgi:hypothetical protein
MRTGREASLLRVTGLNTNTGFLQAQLTISKVGLVLQQTDKRVRPVKAGGIKDSGTEQPPTLLPFNHIYYLREADRREDAGRDWISWPAEDRLETSCLTPEEFYSRATPGVKRLQHWEHT